MSRLGGHTKQKNIDERVVWGGDSNNTAKKKIKSFILLIPELNICSEGGKRGEGNGGGGGGGGVEAGGGGTL